MKNSKSLVVSVSNISDLDKINEGTKYINLDISNCSYEVITYFINNGMNYLYSEIIDDNRGYIYVNHAEFVRAETIIEMIFVNMKKNLSKLEIARYLYISIAKLVSYDINILEDKNESYDLSLISNINNLWGSLSIGRVNDISASKLYYYLCRRMGIDINIEINYKTKEALNKLIIDNQVLMVDLYQDIPYIEANMQTRYFATYNNELELDKKISYIKNKYNDYYLDKSLKNIDYMKEDCLKDILLITEKVINLEIIKPVELSIIYQDIFDKYCPNYDIKINNLYLNNQNKNHFIMISYNNIHYSYNYKKKGFIKINNQDIINNINEGKICLYQNELIPNINI